MPNEDRIAGGKTGDREKELLIAEHGEAGKQIGLLAVDAIGFVLEKASELGVKEGKTTADILYTVGQSIARATKDFKEYIDGRAREGSD